MGIVLSVSEKGYKLCVLPYSEGQTRHWGLSPRLERIHPV